MTRDRRGAEKLLQLGYAAYWQGNYERALVFYEQSMSMDPEYVPARLNHTGTLMAMARYDEALPRVRELYATFPHDPHMSYGLMECLRATEQWGELGMVARETLRRNHADHLAISYLGWATLKEGRHEEAAGFFFRAIEADERFCSAWLGLGWATLFKRELQEAVAAFSSAAIAADAAPNPPS